MQPPCRPAGKRWPSASRPVPFCCRRKSCRGRQDRRRWFPALPPACSPRRSRRGRTTSIRNSSAAISATATTARRFDCFCRSSTPPIARPLSGVRVDVWHCDARGFYSGYEGQGDDQATSTVGQKFLRGVQITDGNGLVTFETIYPGWYHGRTTHIHIKAFLGDGKVATSQLFFPDALSEFIYENISPYAERKAARDTINATDFDVRERRRRTRNLLQRQGRGGPLSRHPGRRYRSHGRGAGEAECPIAFAAGRSSPRRRRSAETCHGRQAPAGAGLAVDSSQRRLIGAR